MLIKDVCEKSGLTKKAVDYYERQGLINPSVLDNGYRNYNGGDVTRLKEIAVLRRRGLSVSEIKSVIDSGNKRAELKKIKNLMELRRRRLSDSIEALDGLIADYDIEKEFRNLEENGKNESLTIKEKLIQMFPGDYGIFMAVHFGRFLNGHIDSEEKRIAYSRIIKYLDNAPGSIPEDLKEMLESMFELSESGDFEKLERGMRDNADKLFNDPDSYLEDSKSEIEDYLKYRLSDEFKNSPAGRLQKLILEFQSASGYREEFLDNLKILSPEYRKYASDMESANRRFIEMFPQSESMYS